MRLSCPNCAAEYELASGLVPPDGRHVQCTACHTRWFARPDAGAPSDEDTIIRRLETRPWSISPVAPVIMPAAEASAEADFAWEHIEAAASEPPAPAAPAEGVPAAPAMPDSAGLPPLGAAPRPLLVARGTAATESPGERAAISAAELPAPSPAPSGRSRLDLTVEPDTAGSVPAPPSRFGRGFLVAAVAVAIAVAAYALRAPITAQVPAAAPALDAYGTFIDGLRESIAGTLPDR